MKKSLPFLLLAAFVFAVYFPALRDGFVWDDTALVLRDPLIRSWRLIPEGFDHFLFTDATASDFYRPIQRLSYTIDYAAFGFRAGLFHLTNIICQIGAASAFFLFARELLRVFEIDQRFRRPVALFAAIIWAIHPVQSSAVIYISGRADPLAATFGFLGLFFGLRAFSKSGRAFWSSLPIVAGLFLLAALSKEIGLIFPLLLCAIFLARKLWAAVARSFALCFVALIYFSLRLPAEHIPAPRLHTPPPPLVRPILVARAFAEYSSLLILPWNLHMERDVESHPTGTDPTNLSRTSRRELQTVVGCCLIAAAIFWGVRSRKNPVALTCLILGAITYLPISGIIPLNASIAEHWIYLPSAFVILAAGLALANASSRRIILFALPLWIAFLGGRTFVRCFDWTDQRTFLQRTIAAGGASPRMLVNLGGLDLREGRLDAAKKNLRAALAQEPEQPFALVNLAAVTIKEDDFETAHQLLDRATRIPIVAARAEEMRAQLALQEVGRVELLRFRLAAHTGAPDWSIERRYIQALDSAGETPAAIAELQSSLRADWFRADSWQLLAALLAKQSRFPEAASAAAHATAYDVHLAAR